MSNAPDLQPKAPPGAAQETVDGQAEDVGSEEPEEEEEEEEESESDDEDNVHFTIDVNQTTPLPYVRTGSYQRMTIQPGGKTDEVLVIPYLAVIKIWRFGGWPSNCLIKICQSFFLAYIHMAIPYQTVKLKSRLYVCNGDVGLDRQTF